MTFRKATTALMTAAVLSAVVGLSPAHRAAAIEARLTWGLYSATSTPFTTPLGNSGCEIVVWFWLWEHGDSDIVRLRARTELRSATDALNAPLIGVYAQRDWQYSNYFPDDAQSFYFYFSATYRVAAGGEYKVRAKMVGDVASWWRRDVGIKADVVTGLGCGGGVIGTG